MNLELLDPFRRQVPDRIDSTLTLPRSLHPPRPKFATSPGPPSQRRRKGGRPPKSAEASLDDGDFATDGDQPGDDDTNANSVGQDEAEPEDDLDDPVAREWRACHAVAFNRRGTYLIAGHASGAVAVHDFVSRTLSAVYSPATSVSPTSVSKKKKRGRAGSEKIKEEPAAVPPQEVPALSAAPAPVSSVVTSVSWSRRSRLMLAASVGDPTVRLVDNTHPFGPEDCVRVQKALPSAGFMGSPATAAATGVSSPPEKEANKESSYSSLMMDDDEEGSGAEQAMSKNKIKRKKEAKLASAAGQTTKTATGKRTGKNARASDSLRTRILPPVCILHPQGLSDTAPPKNSSSAFSSIDSKGSLNGTGVDEADISIGIVPKQQHQSAVVPSTPTIHPLHTKPNTTSSPHASPPVMHVDKSLKERHEAALKRMRIEQEKKDLKSITQTHKGKKSAPATAISSGTSKAYASSTKQKDSKIKNSGAPSNVGSGPVPVTIASSDVVVTGKGKKKSSHKKKDVSASALPIAGPPPKRYQAVVMSFPQPVGGAVQLHPRDGCAGLACLEDGSLVLFRFPSASFNDSCVQQQASKSSPPVLRGAALLKQERDKVGKMYYLVKPSSSLEETIEGGGEDNQKKDESGNSSYFVTCAAFDKNGKQIYAVTKCGTLLGFSLEHPVMEALRTSSNPSPLIYIPAPEPMFRIKIPGGATARQVIVSRNGQLVLVNSADNTLRLYNVEECWALTKTTANPIEPFSTLKSIVKPRFVFQDLVSKVPWACCDFSGDGEYVVGGCNSSSAQYELYLWNTATGALMDRLTGPQLSLHSISWHPTRAFIAVGTSDGLVDLWGPRMDWTAFAPDFQALPMNVEYIEREDEFDEVVDGEEKKETEDEKNLEDELVDVVSVERIPVFDSDSEDESEVFHFGTKIKGMMTLRGRAAAAAAAAGAPVSAATISGQSRRTVPSVGKEKV